MQKVWAQSIKLYKKINKTQRTESDEFKEGEKKRVVIAVILATLVIGTIYTIAYNVYAQPEDKIEVQDRLHQIPLR